MAAYAAIISLSNTINRILNHNRISISLAENQQLLSLLEHVSSFQAFLEKFPDKFNSLEGRMRDLAHEAEDLIEHFMLEQVSSWSDFQTERAILQLKQMIDNIDLSAADLINDMYNSCSSEEDIRGDDSSHFNLLSTAPPIYKDGMVGFEDHMMELKDRLCGEPSKLQVIPICGMAGIGKTTLARNVYDDPSIIDHFVICVWVTISQYSSVQRTLSSILECLKEFNTGVLGLGQSDEEKVYQILMGRRYLVVMDSIWSCKAWDVVKKAFPDNNNGSRVMITTRLCDVATYPDPSSKLYKMDLLSEDQSWELLKRKAFGDEDCPSELENITKDIVSRCKGWPLALVAIAFAAVMGTRLCPSNITQSRDKLWENISESFFEDIDFGKVFQSSDDDDESKCHPSELQLTKVTEEIDLIAKDVKEITDSSSSRSKDVERGGAESAVALTSSSTAPPTRNDAMVGFQDYVLDIKERLCGEPYKLQVIPICGMGGIGKTTLARNVYDDPLIMSHFDIRVWVIISQDFSAQRLFSSIMESLKDYSKDVKGQSDDEKVHKILKGRRYLVVMDDMWDSKAWDDVRRVCPDDGNRSRIVLTTRLFDVASYPDTSSKLHEMSLLNADQSWELFKQKVFAGEDCPSELENIGKEIAKGCKGLPLAIVVIAGLLSTASKNPASWLEIAENVKSAENAQHNQIEGILSLSYVQLPQYLRPCFLYMGSFSEDEEIHVKKLIRLWIAEGFIKSPPDLDSFEKVAEECLEKLVKRNLVLVTKWKWDGRIRSCSLHDLMRDFCIKKAHESKLILNLMDRDIGKESFIEGVRTQHRVNVDSSKLEFLSSLKCSNIHSIRCSRHHSGKLDFFESARLLRVLDAEPLDVRDLPTLVHQHELFHLRYLAVRSYGDIPRSLSMLQNLETLVIHREMGSSDGAELHLFIWLSWCMPQLRHVYFPYKIMFCDPEESTYPLENLQTLSYVDHGICTERILKLIPNLKKLKIDCAAYHHPKGTVCLNDLVHLHRLESLEILGGNNFERSKPRYYKITFPVSLKRLTLFNVKLPLDDIFVVGSLPNLQVLKLESSTCVRGTWETTEEVFPALEVLHLSYFRLKNWITESSHFPRLKHLLIDSCSTLKGIPNDIGEIPTLELIRVRGGANWYLVKSLKQIRREQEDMGNTLNVSIRDVQGYVSYDDEDDDNDDSSVYESEDYDDDDDDDDDDYSSLPSR